MAEQIVESVVQWIGLLLLREASILFNVAEQVQGLQQELILMHQYLKDADAKQEAGEVCILIDQIRQIAYEAEDVIDTYILKIPAPDKHRLMRYGQYLHNAPHLYKVGKKIEAIQSKVQQSIGRLNACGVRRIVPELREGFRKLHKEECWRVQPRSYPYEDDNNSDYVVGLENDISKVLEVVTGEGNTDINVISIVGMGGCGKTTLARKLFNHPFVKECFMNCMAWVFISQEWNTRHIISEILRKVGGPEDTSQLHAGMNVQELVDKLRNILKEKLYLIVLDDVWQREALKEILPAFPYGMSNRGSKIIITTRKGEIIQYQNLQRNLYIHEPQPLSEVESWQLFSKISLSHRTDCDLEGFESLGKEMLKKCGGLPLAIVALAGILNPRGSIGQWQQVNEAVRSRIMEDKGTNVQDLLTLSYDDLPNYLKPCFLLLGLFPEDCQIPAGMLMRMWIAEGFVATHEHMSPEDVAMQFLEELSQRFMIQVVRTNFKEAIKVIQLHDLLRDLCIRKAKEQSFLQIYTAIDDQATASGVSTIVQPRRAALHSSFSFPTQASSLRSLLLLTGSTIFDAAYVPKETIDMSIVHQKFKLLKLLNLWGIKTNTGALPAELGSLIHLRYLSVRASNITELPMSIGNLRNLLTLDYRNINDSNCDTPVKIPNVFSRLKQLRHLFLPVECPWNVMDLQLSSMQNLQILWGVKQNAGDNWLSTELPKLSLTVKKLKINVSTEKELKAAFTCPSLVSGGLRTFHCELRDGLAFQEVKSLSHDKCLHKLILTGLVRMNLSLLLPINLLSLQLKDSMLKDYADPFLALGTLEHLKLLRLSNFFNGTTLACKPGSFLQLEELSIENMKNLVNLMIGNGAMPCLKKLELVSCPCLQELPQGMEFVTTLQQLEYFEMPLKFCVSAADNGWGDSEPFPSTITIRSSSLRDKNWKQNRRSYPYEDDKEKYVIGLEEDIKKLVELLMGEGKSHVHVLSIAGMGGSGKTTLARKLYNHPNAKEYFNCMAWVFISQEWSTRNILSQILRKIRGLKETNRLHARLSLKELMDRVRNTLKDKSFLVVLDDLWTREALEEILPALPWENTKWGSKIIITTRNREISQLPNLQQYLYIHEPQALSEEDSWVLFSKIAFNCQTTNCNTETFERLGKDMLKKCGGLPLAIVALAEILSQRGSIEEWHHVNDSVLSKVMEHTCTSMYGNVQDSLALSYDDLPEALHPCFLYLSLFPEKCEISVGMLSRMWIAEDLVSTQEEMSAEDVAMQCLKELNCRFMIQVVRTNFEGAMKTIHLHHLLYEICVIKAKQRSFLQIFTPINILADRDTSISCKAAFYSSMGLRSLLMLSTGFPKDMSDFGIARCDLKQLRLLKLWGVKTATGSLPIEIGSLIHLRYLSIRASNVDELPSSIGNLKNLLTLDYRDSNNLELNVPNVLGELVLLRHLYLPTKCSVGLEWFEWSALKNLEVLWGVSYGWWSGSFSKEIVKLSTTVKKLKVIVSTVKDLEAAFNCPSIISDRLQTLYCEWRHGVSLQRVNPVTCCNQNLRKLILVGPIQEQVKLSLLFPSNLVSLELRGSNLRDEGLMLTIGALAHLKFLRLSNSYLGTALVCVVGSFPVLEQFYLEHLLNLKIWEIHEGAMPCLKRFSIRDCKNLHHCSLLGLPSNAIHMQFEDSEFHGSGQEAIERGWFKGWDLVLPHNLQAIIEQCDSPIEPSSLNELQEKITAGIYLNNYKQKYWIVKRNYCCYNCFMLYSTNLWCDHDAWELTEMEESGGTFITVGKVPPSSSTRPFHVRGEFDIVHLSQGVTYEITYLVMLPQAAPEQPMQPASSYLLIQNHDYQSREHILQDKARGEWIRLSIGQFQTSSTVVKRKLLFSLYRIEPGLIIRGVIIEPILEAL